MNVGGEWTGRGREGACTRTCVQHTCVSACEYVYSYSYVVASLEHASVLQVQTAGYFGG